MTRLRCAIFTRKSTEEGLEQDFNSLDAQRASCEAYIKSQAGEGWVASRARYDDGGFSGATLERPGLTALIAELEAGRVQIVIVYKVDRLTRSLMDFAKLVERFDAQDVSVVSVTQQFNTTSSMGRLTLNVLLSFAQFEREVTAERIRDKIAQSKKKGMWMGGMVPLGYDVKDKKMIVNPAEVETVRTLFRLYLELGSVTLVKLEADRLGLKTKMRKPAARGRPSGADFTRGHLYSLLATPIYVGDVTHKGERYKGQHEAIIDLETWDAVQSRLKANAVKRRVASNSRSGSWLAGLLYDDTGLPMKLSHAVKAGRRYRYCISSPVDDTARPSPSAWRLPAKTIEGLVSDAMLRLLDNKARLIDGLRLDGCTPDQLRTILGKAEGLAIGLQDARPILRDLITRVDLEANQVRISLDAGALIAKIVVGPKCAGSDLDICPSEPIRLKKRGVESKLVLTNGQSPRENPDPTLIRLIAQAHGVDHADVARVLPLALLAPDIIEDILEGRQPPELTATRLKCMTDLPFSWVEQRQVPGFS